MVNPLVIQVLDRGGFLQVCAGKVTLYIKEWEKSTIQVSWQELAELREQKLVRNVTDEMYETHAGQCLTYTYKKQR